MSFTKLLFVLMALSSFLWSHNLHAAGDGKGEKKILGEKKRDRVDPDVPDEPKDDADSNPRTLKRDMLED